jgi:hypothetical protein
MTLPPGYVCWRHHRRGHATEQEQSDPAGLRYFFNSGLILSSSSSNDIAPLSLGPRHQLVLLLERKRDGAEIFLGIFVGMQRASIEAAQP